MHRVSGRGRNMSDEGVKWAVSRRVWPLRRHGDSGTANIAALKDSTTRAAKDGPAQFHCSAPAMRYEGKCGADSAHANHSENEPSMKGLSLVSTCALKGAWDMSEVPVTHIFYCVWFKTQVETCVTGTLDMSQAPLRHKWKPGFNSTQDSKTNGYALSECYKVVYCQF